MGVESAGREFNVVASAGADIEAEAAVEDTLNGFPIRTGPFHLPGSRATVKLNQGLTDERLIASPNSPVWDEAAAESAQAAQRNLESRGADDPAYQDHLGHMAYLAMGGAEGALPVL